jgi:hypothetical protein
MTFFHISLVLCQGIREVTPYERLFVFLFSNDVFAIFSQQVVSMCLSSLFWEGDHANGGAVM